MFLESKLESLRVKDPKLLSLFKDIPSLPEKDKRALMPTLKGEKGRSMESMFSSF